MAHSTYDYDYLQPADRMRIDRIIYNNTESSDISGLTNFSLEQLQTMRKESAAEEQRIFEKLQEEAKVWESQAGKTLLLDKVIEYMKTHPVKHTENRWETTCYGQNVISNMVYKMSYSIYEDTKYDRETQKSIPCTWCLTWNVLTNSPYGNRISKIAGQNRKRYDDKAELDKYMNGRIKAYAHLFTEISPPIPQEYVRDFCVSGQLLPGYSIESKAA